MKRYYNEAETPLKFHKFYHYITIPFGFLTGLSSLATTILDMESFNYIYAVDYIYLILSVVLAAVIFLGFYSFSSYAWYSLMGYLGIEIAYRMFYLVLYILYIPDETVFQLGNFIVTTIITTLVVLYYFKRKPLFFPKKPESLPTPLSPDVPRFCSHCGTPLNSDHMFCSNCGTPRQTF